MSSAVQSVQRVQCSAEQWSSHSILERIFGPVCSGRNRSRGQKGAGGRDREEGQEGGSGGRGRREGQEQTHVFAIFKIHIKNQVCSLSSSKTQKIGKYMIKHIY